jgi:23S rRNA pseudouridine2604 synthase
MSDPLSLDSPEALRLSKRVAAQLRCSRQEAELYILGGWVSVDGVVEEQPQARVRPEQVVAIAAGARAEPIAPVTLLWHKPAGQPVGDWLPQAGQRWAGDRSGLRLLQVHTRQLAPVLMPPAQASGLVAFTQSPGVARKLTDRQQPLEQEWLLDVHEAPADRDALLRTLTRAPADRAMPWPPFRASWQSDRRLRVVVKGEAPGLLAELCQRLGPAFSGLRRQRLGRVGLDGLPEGQWRYAGMGERF